MKTAYCFDLDGTVTATEILPCIASDLGVADEIATLTRATMDGMISFEASFRLRYLILSRVEVARIRQIVQEIPLSEAVVSFIQSHRENSFLVTGNLDVWIEPILKLCGCRMFASRGAIENGELRLARILNKADAVTEIRSLGYDRVIAVGDGANDAPMFNTADVSIAYGGVHSPAVAAKDSSDFIIHEEDALCRVLQAL